MRVLVIIFIILILFGCLGTQGKDCGYDKECLKSAFEKCEKAFGTWTGENGDIGVKILDKKGEMCAVSVTVQKRDLNISYKTMKCDIPLPGNTESFSVKSDCIGELKEFFLE